MKAVYVHVPFAEISAPIVILPGAAIMRALRTSG